MMRPLTVSIALASSIALLAACDEGTRAETAASHSRESSLAQDLQLAGDSSLARRMAGQDTSAVTESPGMLESSADPESTTARNASNVSRAVPSADGYIGPSCASPARDDQQRCLLGYLAKSDVLLDRYYQALIVRLKSEAGTSANVPEPASVQRLRTAQRAWLVYRDDECRKRTAAQEGPLWAPVRAQCLAEYSGLRARELEDALAKRKSTVSHAAPAKTKKSSARKSAHRRKSRGR